MLRTFDMALPDELTINVLGHMGKRDLKNARLVCKTLSHYASEPLFDKLYISPREEDIRVFKLVTQHPQLHRCVRELEYDATRFSSSLSKWDYFIQLLEFRSRDDRELYEFHLGEYPISEVEDFLTLCKTSGRGEAYDFHNRAFQQCEDYSFVLEGYRKWEECAAYQQRCVCSGEFLQVLILGLRNLDRLESLNFCNQWDLRDTGHLSQHEARYYDSPFGRTWNMLFNIPRNLALEVYNPDGFGDSDSSNGIDALWTITTALGASQRSLREIYSSYLSPLMFAEEQASRNPIEQITDGLSGLKSLTLYLYHKAPRAQTRSASNGLFGLQRLLASSSHLKHLFLSFCDDAWFRGQKFTYSQIFPREGQWTSLTAFYLIRIDMIAKDLVHLLTVRMPNLQLIVLGEIKLLQGRWEGVIENMKRSMHLSTCSVGLSNLYHFEGQKFSGYKYYKQENVRKDDIVNYIVYGGRHPCLLPDEPDSASGKYLSAPWL